MRNHQPGSVGNDDDRICLTILTQLHLIVVVRQQIFLFDLIYVCFSDDRKRWCLWLIWLLFGRRSIHLHLMLIIWCILISIFARVAFFDDKCNQQNRNNSKSKFSFDVLISVLSI